MKTVEVTADSQSRARLSLGTSTSAVYRMVAAALVNRHPDGGTLIDVGCGRGDLRPFVEGRFTRYIGADAVRYDGFPSDVEFQLIDLDSGRVALPDDVGDVVVGAETIEHLENPRAFVRELTRLTKPGGWVVVTTPNQLSLLSKLGLVVRNEFPAFRGSNYPAHLTALLEIDLRRIATECGWTEVAFEYSGTGRIPGLAQHWPGFLSRWFKRLLSDNILMVGRKPMALTEGSSV